jgi:hypothetical protein
MIDPHAIPSERVAPIKKQRRFIMFGRIVEFTPKPEMKDEIVNVLRKGSADPEEAAGIYGVPALRAGDQDGKVDHRHSLGRETGCRPLGARRVAVSTAYQYVIPVTDRTRSFV